MSNLINGYSDILSRNNLTTNGSFRINQRGNFTGWAPCAVNDYVADCWRVIYNGLDYCEAIQNSDGYLGLKGYGKKGQYFRLKNKDISNFGQNGNNSLAAITGTVVAYNAVGGGPLYVSGYPRFNSSGDTMIFIKDTILKSGETTENLSVYTTLSHNFNYDPQIFLSLKVTGQFEVYLYNYRELAGAFRNPPSFVPVPYAEDLQRAERYYQEGSFKGDVYVPFRTKMAGTPSVTLSSGSASDISADGFVTGSSTGVYTWTAEIA